MKLYIIGFIICIFSYSVCYGQNTNISFKIGVVKCFVIPTEKTKGYAYRSKGYNSPLPVLGLEFSLRKNWPVSFLSGFSLQPVFTSFCFNDKNIDNSNTVSKFGEGDYSIQAYLGVEKGFSTPKLIDSKNSFSICAGLGLNYYYGRSNSQDSGVKVNEFAQTRIGERLVGTMFSEDKYVVGAPSIFMGIRYNIYNAKGKKVIKIELACNYGLVRYFNHRISYQLDGQPRDDELAEKGANFQLSISIPFIRIGKKQNK